MTDLPRISIAVPSFNQGRFIRETLQSLLAQEYPNLEVIVQDGGSTDGAIAIAQEFAQRFPDVFRLHVEKDRGHAHAVNMAFAKSTGEILGFLNTDDTLYPGCLHRVAREIDPARGRYIVFGRCLFTGEGSPYVGLEHPAEFHGHFDLLAVWKRGYNTIPQPSTFWHRTVYEACGGFDERYNQGLDYLQWCNFSKRFAFHKVEALWSTYRMHPVSISANKTQQEWLAIMLAYSRMHWGSWWQPLRWRCELSHWWHDANRHERARPHANRAVRALGEGRYGTVLWESLKTLTLSPRLVWHRFVLPLARRGGLPALDRRRGARGDERQSVGRYADGWIGPVYRTEVPVPANARRLEIRLRHAPPSQEAHRRMSIKLLIDGILADRREVKAAGEFSLVADLTTRQGRSCRVEVLTREYFVPRFFNGAADDRKLSAVLVEQRIEQG